MVAKRLIIFFGFLAFLVLTISGVYAVSCSVVLRSVCNTPSQILLGLSSDANAHAQITSISPGYDYVLCCDFPAGAFSTSCSNELLSLSSDTNAHAEIPESSGYTNKICYSNIECASSDNQCANGYDIEMLSLSSSINAHVGKFADYTKKICCNQLSNNFAYWANTNGGHINTADIKDTVVMYAGFSPSTNINGKTITYEIYKNIFPNPKIATITPPVWCEIVNNVPICFANWIAGKKDDGEWQEGNSADYYFKVKIDGKLKATSSNLIVTKPERNAPPIANIFSPEYGAWFAVNENIVFSSNGSGDEDDSITRILWDLDDGKTSNILKTDIKDSYSQKGQKNIELYITSGEGDRELTSERDKASILIIDGEGYYVFAKISYPPDNEEIIGSSITFESEGSYALDCKLPTNSQHCTDTSPDSIDDDCKVINNLYCEYIEPDSAKWEIYEKTSSNEYTKIKTHEGSWSSSSTYTLNKILEGDYKVELEVKKSSKSGKDNSLFSVYFAGEIYECINNGRNWKEINTGEVTDSMQDCKKDDVDEICCPSGYDCVEGEGSNGNWGCKISSNFLCGNYETQSDCEHYNLDVAKRSVANMREDGETCPNRVSPPPDGNPGCVYYLVNCRCVWKYNEEAGKETCGGEWSTDTAWCDISEPGTGSCKFFENTNDNCDDGFLTQSVTADWTWALNNLFGLGYSSDPDYVCDETNCYYDPYGESEECKDGSNTIPCPEQIKLMFFSFYSVIVTFVVIALIYVWLLFGRVPNGRGSNKKNN